MSHAPWYHDGLQFQCYPGCGRCCTGDPGYVWVNDEEIAGLARALGVDRASFIEKYTREVRSRRSLIEHRNGDCALFDNVNRRCRAYRARPRQCRTWPFWKSNLRSPGVWEATCRMCPGCGQGPVVPLAEIQALATAIRI